MRLLPIQSAFWLRLAVVTPVAAFAALVAHASGWAPFASNDKAAVVRGGIVSVLTSGADSVLANDWDIENDPLTAVLVEAPDDGELTFNEDGTFVYRHDGDFGDKSDRFYYRAFDGTAFSRVARVDIEILPGDPVAPVITGQKQVVVDEDKKSKIDIGDLQVDDPDSNFPKEFTLEVFDGFNYQREGIEITPAPNYNGPLVVPVRVFDGIEYSNVYDLQVEVRPVNDPPTVTGGPEGVQEAVANVPFSMPFADYFSDIDQGDSFTFSAAGLPKAGSLAIDPSTGLLSGTPADADARDTPYTIAVRATDKGGAAAEVRFELLIYPDDRADLKVTAVVSANPVTVGETATWNITVENLGPADLDEGELRAQWNTGGPALSLVVPGACTGTGNDSRSPAIRCAIGGLPAFQSVSYAVQGTQAVDGDYSLVAVVIADDPVINNNSFLASAQVVAEFSDGPAQILGLSAADVASADFNGDGLYDVVAAGDAVTTVFFNAGNRTLRTPGSSLGAGSGGRAAVTLDWNGDGHTDIAVAGTVDAAAKIYLNDGSGGVADRVDANFRNSGTVMAATAGDFNRDGNDELVLTGANGTVMLARTDNSGYRTTLLPAAAGRDITTADFDNDGYPDIAVILATDRSVRLLKNSGNGSDFSGQTLQRGSVAGVTAADINQDGNVDLLLAVDGVDLEFPESRILIQQSDGSFPAGTRIGASPLCKLLAGDVNGDGRQDIVAINEAGVHQVYVGKSGGGFELDEAQIVSDGMRRGVLVDLNADSSLDLVLAGRTASVLEFHANNGIGLLGRGDRAAPVLTLNGETSMVLAAGQEYLEPGATAVDDIDGDLTDAIVTSGSVNPAVVGTYTVSYSVADRAGNKASATRTVKVGVNEGVGGGGGGRISPAFVALLLLLVTGRLRYRHKRS